MPKYQEFKSKPIIGELSDGGIRTTMNIEKLQHYRLIQVNKIEVKLLKELMIK